MNHYWYLLSLIFSLGGIFTYDLVNDRNILKKGTRLAIIATFGILLVADIIGINLSIFQTNPEFVSGIFLITPNLPLEEFLLLLFLPYLSIMLYSLIQKKP